MLPLAQLQLRPLFEDQGIPLAIMGMLVVFVALVLLSAFISWLPKVMDVLHHFHPAPEETSLAPYKGMEEMPEELLVVIAAAAAEVVGGPHRIVRARQVTPQELTWSMEGRRQQHTSHSRKPSR